MENAHEQTLSAPPNVVQNVRYWAEERGTSLNQYIRDLLIAKDREIRLELLRHALEVNHDGVISLQILQEFTNVMLKRSLATDEQIEGYYSYFYRLVGTEVTSDMLRDAIRIRREYGIQYHDSVMVAAAKKLGCHEIITEDLSDGQLYCGMAVVNPFKGQVHILQQ